MNGDTNSDVLSSDSQDRRSKFEELKDNLLELLAFPIVLLLSLTRGVTALVTAGGSRALLWKLVTLPFVGLVYAAVISEGLRTLIPVLGTKLWKLPLPWIADLQYYKATHRLDLAHLMAILLMVAVCWLWTKLIRAILGDDKYFERSGWRPEAYRTFITVLAVVIAGGDAILFYYAVSITDWGEVGGLAFFPLIGTVIYLGVLVFISLVSVHLEGPTEAKED